MPSPRARLDERIAAAHTATNEENVYRVGALNNVK